MLPERKVIKSALIAVLEAAGSLETSKVYSHLIERFNLSDFDLAKTTNGGENFFEKEVRWAKKDLVGVGTIKRPAESGRGIWELATNLTSCVEDLSPILCDSANELEERLSCISPTNGRPDGQAIPRKISTSADVYSRDARVISYVLTKAAGVCEACGKLSPFHKDNGVPYLEIHHLRRLADGGSDTVENAIAVCPNCHRELHHGKNRSAIKSLAYSRIMRLVAE